jgi:hypothetical protein
MCVMLTDQQPSSTKIFLLDVMMNASPHKLLVYTNNLEIEPKTNKGPVPEWGNKWVNMNNPNTYFGKEFINRRGNALMIIPIPNPFKVTNFGLVDTSTALMKQFTQQVVKSCNNLKDYPPEGDNYAVLRASKPIPIQKVGKYQWLIIYMISNIALIGLISLYQKTLKIDIKHFLIKNFIHFLVHMLLLKLLKILVMMGLV